MMAHARQNLDPVLPDQGGREMPKDPGGSDREEIVRRCAYALYERRGRKNGYDVQDWLDAEAQVRANALD